MHTAGNRISIERVYWYLEGDSVTQALKVMPRVCVRACARDDLDDDFELIRNGIGSRRCGAVQGLRRGDYCAF